MIVRADVSQRAFSSSETAPELEIKFFSLCVLWKDLSLSVLLQEKVVLRALVPQRGACTPQKASETAQEGFGRGHHDG